MKLPINVAGLPPVKTSLPFVLGIRGVEGSEKDMTVSHVTDRVRFFFFGF